MSETTIFLVGVYFLPKLAPLEKFPFPSLMKIKFGAISFPTATSKSPSLSKSASSVE